MVNLIKSVKLSKKNPTVGESIHIQVQLSDQAADVSINGLYGANQYLQFRSPGSFTVVVAAALGKDIEQIGERVKVGILNPDVAKPPIIWAGQNRYQPRTIEFSIANADAQLSNYGTYTAGDRVRQYAWNFGDGTTGVSEGGGIGHDYTDALDRDRLYTNFDVQADAYYANGLVASAKKTISVFNTYGLNKMRRGVLTPRVAVQNPAIIPTAFFFVGEVICLFTVTNLEDEEIAFTAEKHEWLTADVAENRAYGPADETALTSVAPSFSSAAIGVQAQVAPSFETMDLRVPARSTITVERVFSQDAFTKNVFGVAIHLSGIGMCSKLPAISSAYIEVKLPMQWSGLVSDAAPSRALQQLASAAAATNAVVTHQDLAEYYRRASVANVLSPKAPPADTSTALVQSRGSLPQKGPGSPARLAPQKLLDTANQSFYSVLANLLDPNRLPFDQVVPMVGQECDPDNVPDNLPDGMVCQLTAEVQWRYVPGRVLNAKKGDCLLDPGGPGLVGQLLRQVTPAQFYSHCGIMTKNHIEVTHSTGSDDWLKDHLAGSLFGQKGTEGFDPAALKYLWPGTVKQTIDNAYYGEWITSPDTGPYRISDFSFAPDLSDSSTIIYPVVVKPNPFDETAAVRGKLHAIADAALVIKGHYRFYCYTKPEIALGPEGIAGSDSGWAQGTIATTCSSFIWLAAQHANVKLEGPNKITSVGDLEPKDVTPGGAAADGSTLDGLYFYTAAERRAAANWLFNNVFDVARNKAGWLGEALTDAADSVANQVCNNFASDSTDDDDEWKTTGPANSVSPDNILFWDSPGSGNQAQFRSVYGHMEEVFYRPGTYAQVPIFRWNLVPTKGTLTGRVTANADVSGANVSLLGSGLQDVVVRSDGRFEFDNVPSGDYQLTAGLNIGGYWNSATVPMVHINAGQTTDVPIALQPPPEIYRLVTIWVEKQTDWSSAFAHSPSYFAETKTAQVWPFHSHAHLDFDGPPNYTPRAHIGFDIDLNADLSITVSWSASEFDDETEGGSVNGGANVPKNAGLSWNHLVVANDDPIDNDATTINFTINNDQANH
jgi:hypothetical protein